MLHFRFPHFNDPRNGVKYFSDIFVNIACEVVMCRGPSGVKTSPDPARWPMSCSYRGRTSRSFGSSGLAIQITWSLHGNEKGFRVFSSPRLCRRSDSFSEPWPIPQASVCYQNDLLPEENTRY